LIDITKPLELADGTPVTFVGRSHLVTDGIQVQIEQNTKGRRVGENRHFKKDGVHVHGNVPRLRNVATAPVLDTTQPLQTVDGKKVSYIGKLEDGRIVVSIHYATWSGQPATELRYADGRKSSIPGTTSGDDVIVKVTTTHRYRNIYADGSMGETTHDTEDAAKLRSKYGKVRVGVLHQTLENGKLVRAALTAGTPWFRNRSVPNGRVALPTDY
jgi:hypothetical protein